MDLAVFPRWREEGAGDPSVAALAVEPNGSLGGDLSLWCPFLLSSLKPPAGRLSTLPGPWSWGPLLPQAAVTRASLGTGRPEVWPGSPGSSSLLWKLFLRETCWLLSGLWLPWKRSKDGRRGPHSRGCCLGPLPGRRVQAQRPETVVLWSTQRGELPQDWGLLGAGPTRGLGMEGKGPGVSDALPVSSRACSWRGHPAPKAPR